MNDNVKVRTVLADPPWVHQSGDRHYLTLPVERIEQLGIALEPLLADDAVCWIWVTNATIPDGLRVLRAWGFRYAQTLTWVKPRLGLGRPMRNMTEHVLLGLRGKPEPKSRAQGTWLFAPVQPPHSHKPEEMHAIAERMFDGPFLELFARRPRPGWLLWGNEVRSDVDLIGFPVPDSPLTRGEPRGEIGDAA